MLFAVNGAPRAGVLLSSVLLLVGCETYQPAPLQPAAHHRAWLDRSPADESVRAFASRLAESGEVWAPDFNPEDGLTLAEGEIVAMVFHPELRLARLRAGVATANADHAGLWGDPSFSIDVLRITESVANPWVVSPGLSITIPLSGRLEVEKSRADAELRVELDRVAEAEWRVRGEVRQAWMRWSADHLRLDETARLVASMDSLVASTGRLAEAGEMVRTEASLFAIEQAQRRHELRRLRSAVAEGEQHLRSLLGLAPEAPIAFTPLLKTHEVETGPGWYGLLQRNPTLQRLEDEYEVAEQRLHLEIRKQYPDLTIGPQYEDDQGQSRIGFVGAIPLPIINGNRQGIAVARAERELARAAHETECEQIMGRLAAARIRLGALQEDRRYLATEMAPLVDRQLADARRLLELGEGGGLVLLESLTRSHESKLQLIAIQLDEALASAEIEHLIGPPSIPSTPTDTNPISNGREVIP